MSGSFEFYRDFHSVGQAEAFAEMLNGCQIPYRIEKSKTLLDAAIVGHGLIPPALIKIRRMDFAKVNELLRKNALENSEFVERHYLHEMDDKELIAIVRQPVDWNVEDVAVARKILNDRGIPIPKEHVEDFTKKINAELAKGKKENRWSMLVYLLIAIGSGIMFNPFFILGGVAVGWYYWHDKTVDNQGGKFYTFEKNTRFYGQLIFYFSLLSILAGAILIYLIDISKPLSINQRTQHFRMESVL